MFLALRNEAVVRGQGEFRKHRVLKSYERRGNSPLFSWYGLPRGCTTIFFPGCALPGTRPERIIDLYTELRRQIPQLGLVLDCCTKPSHDLGQQGYFKYQFSVLRRTLVEEGIKEVLLACPNCFCMFNDYGAGLKAYVPHPCHSLICLFPPSIYPSRSASDKFNAFRYRFCPSVSGAANRHMPDTLTT
jgi:hypothetical protein